MSLMSRKVTRGALTGKPPAGGPSRISGTRTRASRPRYSFNSRTVPSSDRTPSGKRIYTLTMGDRPDQFVEDVLSAWRAH